jgi:hypothetical protein
MSLTLTAQQRRVVGVLMEKALATPDQYPMTLNSMVAACNQKSNRDPVVDYNEGDVSRAVQQLTSKGLVTLAPTAHGSRSNRFQHHVEEKLGWGKRWQAIMAELLLRGPQTPGELRSRASRMCPMHDLQMVQVLLDELAANDPPYAKAMPREPGRSAIRHQHLLYEEGEGPPAATVVQSITRATTVDRSIEPDSSLVQRVADLEAAVAELRAEIETLRPSQGMN